MKSGWGRIIAVALQGVWEDAARSLGVNGDVPALASIDKALGDLVSTDIMKRARAMIDMCRIIGSHQTLEMAHRAMKQLYFANSMTHGYEFFASAGSAGVLDSYARCLWLAPRRLHKWYQREFRKDAYKLAVSKQQALFEDPSHVPDISKLNLKYERPHEWHHMIPKFEPRPEKIEAFGSTEQAADEFALSNLMNTQRPQACNTRERVNLVNSYAGVWGSAWRGALARGGALAGCHPEAFSAAVDMVLMAPDQAKLDKQCYGHSFDTGNYMAWAITLMMNCVIDSVFNSASIGGRPRHAHSPENRWRRKLHKLLHQFLNFYCLL